VAITERIKESVCVSCGQAFVWTVKPGNPRRYCSNECYKRAHYLENRDRYLARKRESVAERYPLCAVDGCRTRVRTAPFDKCPSHRVDEQVSDRFWAKVDKSGSCWEWTGAIAPTGYGMLSIHDKAVTAHRTVWRMLKGPIPDGLHIDHICHNRKCVRIDHLRLATPKQNVENHSGARSDSQTGIRGVSPSRGGGWVAQVWHNGEAVLRKVFSRIEDAEEAAIEARNRFHTNNDADRTTFDK